MSYSLFGRKKATVWYLLDCSSSTPRARSLKVGDSVPLGGDALWSLTVSEDQASVTTGSNTGSISHNGKWYVNKATIPIPTSGPEDAMEHTLIVPAAQGNLPLLLKRGTCPVWGDGAAIQFEIQTEADGHQGGFDNFAAVRRALTPGRVDHDALVWVQGGTSAFYARDIWSGLTEKPQEPVPGGKRKSARVVIADDDEEPEIEGNLKCLYCPGTFNRGDALYIHKKMGEKPFHPGSLGTYARDGRVMDREGNVYSEKSPRACPHCGQRLPESFFEEDPKYTIISLVGQSMSGKSYYLATLFHELSDRIPQGFGYNGDDASLNSYMDNLSKIPFQSGEPGSRYIEKTGAATQESITYQGEMFRVPRPFISKITKNQKVAFRTVFYDNPGEHFTSVHEGELGTIEARVAASHLAHAQAIFLLYDPTADAVIRGKLGLERNYNKEDYQRSMLTNLSRCIDAQWDSEMKGTRSKDLPLACLVAKWDEWGEKLAPDLHRPQAYTKDGWLDYRVVEENSQRVEKFLQDNSCGVSKALESISSKVTYFPVSALGSPPVEAYYESEGSHVKVKVWAPSQPAQPWAVHAPLLWALGWLYPDHFPSPPKRE